LVILSSLNENEAQLLLDLEPYAGATAQAFQEAIFKQLMENWLYISPLEYELGKSALRKWFVYLFTNAASLLETNTPEYVHRTLFGKQLHQKSGIPVHYMFGLMEVIFQFGKRVTNNSSNPEGAYSAFQKVLAIEFAMNQIYEDIHYSNMADMFLNG
jgi:hypothetical protein